MSDKSPKPGTSKDQEEEKPKEKTEGQRAEESGQRQPPRAAEGSASTSGVQKKPEKKDNVYGSPSQGAVRKYQQEKFSKKSPNKKDFGGKASGDGKTEERNKNLKQLIAKKKKEMRQIHPQQQPMLLDPYSNASASNYISRDRTAFCYDREHVKHRCEWDDRYPENPSRAVAIMDRLRETRLLDHCHTIKNEFRIDLYDRIIDVHSREHYHNLKRICETGTLVSMENSATDYDSVYFNTETFNAACRAVSATLNIVMSVAGGTTQNGMAVVRPPGHHAMSNEFNGYCFFNNVAIAAQACIRDKIVKKILIVDFDVHHGQGTQQIFYERNDVLYFSIHRYEHGTFWPNLLEGNFNYIGKGDGMGFNVNVPLNATGLKDDDYLAVVFSLLLPIAYEYNPDLVIVSAGYDAVVGCPEGRMNVTPGFYAHIITLLSSVAKGHLAVVLEGGYFLPTLAEGASLTLKALLGGPCPMLEPIRCVHPTVIETICNVRRMLLNRWNCFKHCETIALNDLSGGPDEHKFVISYFGEPPRRPHPTRNCYPELTIVENLYFKKLNQALNEKYRASLNLPVVYVYDETMLLHKPKEGELERPERPERLTSIMKLFQEFGLDQRLVRIPVVTHDIKMYTPHDPDHCQKFESYVSVTNDIYVNEFTETAATVAVSSLLSVVDAVMQGTARAGVAIIRPPGHHAEHNKAMGFCFINNVAVAANYLKDKHGCTRTLIVDFDIHHGNGTQNIFYNTNEVMYISIHRDDNGKFFPAGSNRNYTDDGHGLGRGYNINIPFNKDKMGDSEYLSAFHNIVLPAAYSFAPKVVLVSAGFDAGINDPLGGYQVSPETFGHMTHMLKSLAEGRLILVLEGGYNLTTTSYSLAICTKALLGDPVIMPHNIYQRFSKEACKTINNVAEHLKQYHNVFKINKKLSLLPLIAKKVDRFTSNYYNVPLYKELDIERVESSDYVEQEMRRFNESDY